ncbi:hypothetical protein SAY87_012819 [Trapa incisa]|uniref:Glycine-rich protein n=1 Tax=Trapa incisa TaxID=236973 RepID=A0AAN7GTY9_9MYRT|nr:hypothetical protein SAY87_012819 [Trapa incisa]
MSCVQAASVKLFISTRKDLLSFGLRSKPFVRVASLNQPSGKSLKLSSNEFAWKQITPPPKHCLYFPNLKYRQLETVGLFGGKEKPEGENEGSAWKSLEKAMGSFRKDRSIEEVLRQQIEKQEFYDDGSTGGKPPRQGGGGGGDSGGAEDDGLSGLLDEILQVVLATLGFIFLYAFIITGEELTRLAKDYIKYLFGRNKSVRLRRAMYKWGRFYKRMTEKKEIDPYWLEREIINTTTWWDSPEKYRHLLNLPEENVLDLPEESPYNELHYDEEI